MEVYLNLVLSMSIMLVIIINTCYHSIIVLDIMLAIILDLPVIINSNLVLSIKHIFVLAEKIHTVNLQSNVFEGSDLNLPLEPKNVIAIS